MKFTTLALALGVSFSGSAFATQAVWNSTVPWGSATTAQYAEWNVFDNSALTTGDITPDVALSAGTTASVRETTGNAFIPGSGNVYSFSGDTAFTSTLSGTTGELFDVYLRIATVGTLANTTATLNGVAATAVLAFNENQGPVMGGASAEQELYWKWTGVSGASLYTFNFSSLSSSMSLDQVAMATVAAPLVATPVPEPETYGMMALGLGLVAFVRRRQSQQSV